MTALLVVALEGLRVLWGFRLRGTLWWSSDYITWRLGTVYGAYRAGTGRTPDLDAGLKSLWELLGDAWRDREQVVRFLCWRREMRVLGRRQLSRPTLAAQPARHDRRR